MNRFTRLVLLSGIAVSLAWSGVAVAQDPGDAESQEVTQAELAQMLVNLMGLTRFVSSPATPQELFRKLVESGVYPEDGWKEDAVVTKAVLARVLVQALGAADEIDDPSDPNAWVNWLKENGIPFDTVGEGVANVTPSAEPVAGLVLDAGLTTDPLRKQQVFGDPDEKQLGADIGADIGMAVMAPAPPPPSPPVTPQEVRRVISAVPVPRPPTSPVTPDGGR